MLLRKQKIDRQELENYKKDLDKAKDAKLSQLMANEKLVLEEKHLKETLNYEQYKLDECKKDL